jgi:hypothetical protein
MTRPARTSAAAASTLIRMSVLAFVISSCGALGGPTEADTVAAMIQHSEASQTNLTRAVAIATSSGQTMSAEAQSALTSAEQALLAFNESTDSFEGAASLEEIAQGYAQSANLVLGLLAEGNVDVAAEVTRTQLTVKYPALNTALRARQNELGGPPSSGPGAPLAILAVVAAGIAALALTRLRSKGEKADESPRSTPTRPEALSSFPTSGIPEDPLLELKSDLPPIGSEPAKPAAPTGPLRNPEATHSVRGGLRTVELEGIIDAALATVSNTGWEVAIQCPTVHVLVDPLRMRRLLSNLLLSATAHGAEHIGLVAEIVGDRVEVNVGHDGSLLADRGSADDTDVPPEVEHQLTVARQLLQGMHAEVRWTRWRGVSLYTVELVRGPEEIEVPGSLAQIGR